MVNEVAVSAGSRTIQGKIRLAAGGPVDERRADNHVLVKNGRVDVMSLMRVTGITLETLRQLGLIGVNYLDGIDEAKLDLVIKDVRIRSLVYFEKIMAGSGKDKAEILKMFNELWALANRGQLTLESWNAVVEKAGLKELKQNDDSFKTMFGAQRGYKGSKEVNGTLKLRLGLKNILGNLPSAKHPPTGNPVQDEANQLANFKAFADLCSTTRFNVFHVEDLDKVVMATINAMAKGKKIDTNRKILLKKIEGGLLGENMQKLAGETSDWNVFLIRMFKEIEEAAGRMHTQKGAEGYYAGLSKDLKTINSILKTGGSSDRWGKLVDQLSRLFRQEDRQILLDVSKF